MQISLDTGQASTDELTALIALLASLGGRLPAGLPAPVPAGTQTRPAPPPPAVSSASEQAEALIQQEAARVAGAGAPPPPPADDDGDAGEAADPTTLDADGIPWDARIHAGTKTQNKDKTWKKLRGVSEVLYGEVHAELQEKYGRPAEAAPPPPAASAAPPPPAETGNAPAAPTPPVESVPTAAASPAPAPAESAPGAGRFADFPSFVQGVNAIRTPNIPYLELNGYAQTLGVSGGFKDIKDRPDLWETFYGLAGGQ